MRPALFLALTLRTAFGCSCGPIGPVCTSIDRIEVAFVGVPVAESAPRNGLSTNHDWYRFTISESLRGLPADTKEVIVDPGSGGTCEMTFKLGESYAVFGFTWPEYLQPREGTPKGLRFMTNVCTGSRPAREAAADIVYLRQLARDPQPATVFGSVRVHDDESRVDSAYPPVPSAKLRISGRGLDVSTQADDTGRFMFPNVPPGDYTLTAQAPGLESLRKSYPVKVPAHGCAQLRVGLFAKGVLSGQVIDRLGRPVAGVRTEYSPENVETPPADYQNARTATDQQGRFAFAKVAPGDYVVGVYIESAPSPTAGIAPTYWPGVPTRTEARTIHLALNETRTDLVIPVQPTPTRHVRIRVVWPDGRGVENAEVSAQVNKGIFASAQTDSDGGAIFEILAGVSYVFDARYVLTTENTGTITMPYTWVTSKPVSAPKGDEWTEVTLVLTEHSGVR